ncbi:coagulation factor IIIa [Scyliorhinus canicula]|uniref:coagulation factor IIIa n=1 Tax=Scyliorhinus canicula TaxID=7830 RepID=UPI0018F37171|nr:coagulation factor IIIa [Scyliorhinus canicula]
MGSAAIATLALAMVCFHGAAGASLQPVTNLKWTSFNFRTTLQWESTSNGAVYTVRVRGVQTDWARKRECTRIRTTSCDMTSMMQNVTERYVAEVFTLNANITDEIEEPPVAESTPIQLLSETEIGEPNFKLFQNSSREARLLIEDTVTSIRFSNNTPKTLRDIYGPNLQYKVTYWKDGTSGKRDKTTNNQVVLIKVDEGVTYCFSVEIKITSPYKHGPRSQAKCTKVQNPEYGLGFYAFIIVGTLVVLSVIIGVTVCLCRRKAAHSKSETNPLKAV